MERLLTAEAQAHLGRALGVDDFRIVELEPISGNGISRMVAKLVATCGGHPETRSYVLMLAQNSSPVQSDWDAEFGILRALAADPMIPVPAAYCVEPDPGPLGAPFLLAGWLPGTTSPRTLLTDLAPVAQSIVEQSFTVLGHLAARDVGSLDLGPAFAVPAPEDVWRLELARCESVIDDSRCAGEVVTNAAFRFLHRVPPPVPEKVSVVHGDYRLGNYLFDRTGLTGVIDWEMVHVGDAVEDLAWSLLPLWELTAHPGRAGGVLSRDEAISAWELGSGMRLDPAALAWWTIFCHVKAIGIWATARHKFDTDDAVGVLPGLVGYALIQRHEALVAGLLREVSV